MLPGSLVWSRRSSGQLDLFPRLQRAVTAGTEPRADGLTPKLLCWPPIDCYTPYQWQAQGYGYSYVTDPLPPPIHHHGEQRDQSDLVVLQQRLAAWVRLDGSGYDTTTAAWATSWFLYSDAPDDYSYCTDDGMGGYIEDNYTAIVDYVTFENPVFCFLTTTWVDYYPQEVDGNSDGSMDGWYDSYIFGSPCSGWLSPQAMQLHRNY
ncbi:hypothetical protein SBA4_3680009 [Candidatus Sulfopaludibacter sp. SbA4]|nr:hypothetical protein SBA4_3680009 [Candidatus Sulfopaludibacter sp. SbA4]